MFLASLLRAIVAIRFTARPSPQRAPAAWQPSTPKGSSPKARTDTEAWRLIQSCTDVESPLFKAHGKAVAQRNDRRYQFAGLVNHPVEFLDRDCVAIAFLCRQRHSARPEYVVRDEQSSRAQSRQRQLKRLGILPLGDVVKNEVELARRLLKRLKCVAEKKFHALAHSRLSQIPLRALDVRRIAVCIKNLPLWPHRTRQPKRGISDSRSHFKHPPRAGQNRQLIEHAAACRPDNRYFMLAGISLHLAQDRIARRQQ